MLFRSEEVTVKSAPTGRQLKWLEQNGHVTKVQDKTGKTYYSTKDQLIPEWATKDKVEVPKDVKAKEAEEAMSKLEKLLSGGTKKTGSKTAQTAQAKKPASVKKIREDIIYTTMDTKTQEEKYFHPREDGGLQEITAEEYRRKINSDEDVQILPYSHNSDIKGLFAAKRGKNRKRTQQKKAKAEERQIQDSKLRQTIDAKKAGLKKEQSNAKADVQRTYPPHSARTGKDFHA